MSQPLLEIKLDGETLPKVSVNLLPCAIHHDGPVDPAQGYWKPTKGDDGKNTAHFRGRKLLGKTVKVPEGYRGIVVERKDEAPAEGTGEPPEAIDVDAEEKTETGQMNSKAEFDEMVVWGHESTADASSDPYVRGMEEWVAMSEQVHSY